MTLYRFMEAVVQIIDTEPSEFNRLNWNEIHPYASKANRDAASHLDLKDYIARSNIL